MSAIDLYARLRPGFDERVAHALAVLQSVASDHAGAVVQATSLGAEDMVVTDLIARHHLNIGVATLDTGMLHAQTVALIPVIEERYGIEVHRFKPRAESVLHFVRDHGERAMFDS
ncbi:MAG TPA: phosphoadenosine phosphosulfate reductase family protein, partial [Rubrivivax sp.]